MGFKHTNGQGVNGTCLQGYLDNVPYAQLLRVFGPPDEHNGDKTSVEWFLEFDNGVVATIYDYCGEYPAFNVETISNWHIGGYNPAAVQMVKEALVAAGCGA
jgi:hypothetical protein